MASKKAFQVNSSIHMSVSLGMELGSAKVGVCLAFSQIQVCKYGKEPESRTEISVKALSLRKGGLKRCFRIKWN